MKKKKKKEEEEEEEEKKKKKTLQRPPSQPRPSRAAPRPEQHRQRKPATAAGAPSLRAVGFYSLCCRNSNSRLHLLCHTRSAEKRARLSRRASSIL